MSLISVLSRVMSRAYPEDIVMKGAAMVGPDKPVVLLTGGNPQIAKAYGDAPVQEYIAAMPTWKRAVGQAIDALITQRYPDVLKAVKWNNPLYGAEENHWFLSFRCYTKKVNVTFFNGIALDPMPEGTSKHPKVRYHDIFEDKPMNLAKMQSWIDQAYHLPGEKL